MRSLFSLLFMVVLVLAVVGYFRGWYGMSGDGRGMESGNVTLTLDSDKVRADVEKAKDRTKELSGEVREEARDLTEQAGN